MPARECKRWIDAHSKQLIVILIDDFGQKSQLQTSLIADVDHDGELEKLIEQVNANETKFVVALKKRNFSDAAIDAMKKKPGECGCQ